MFGVIILWVLDLGVWIVVDWFCVFVVWVWMVLFVFGIVGEVSVLLICCVCLFGVVWLLGLFLLFSCVLVVAFGGLILLS